MKVLLVGLLGLVLILSACSNPPEEYGMVLQLTTPAPIKSIDPAQAEDSYSATEVMRVYEPLLQYHPWKRPYTLIPLLAEAMPTISKDALTYTFKIRKRVLFQDDGAFPENKGRELIAEDFVYSLKRIADPHNNSPGWWLFENRIVGLDEWRNTLVRAKTKKPNDYSIPVEGMKTLDKYTIQFKLKKSYPQFLHALATPYAAAYPHEIIDKFGEDFFKHAAGTGPFYLETANPGIVQYKRNKTYWGDTYPSEGSAGDKEAGLLDDAGKKLPFVDLIVIRIIPDEQQRWLDFLDGKIDIGSLPKDNFNEVLQADSISLNKKFQDEGIHLLKEPSVDLSYTAMNNAAKPFQDKRVRQAISLALDQEEAIKIFYNGMAQSAQTPIPPGISGYDPDYRNTYGVGDITHAQKLLTAAGYPKGKGFPEVTYDTLDDTMSRQMGEYAAKKLAKIGLKLKLKSNTWLELQEKIKQRHVQLWNSAWAADYADAENFLQIFYGPNATSGGTNDSYYKNSVFDKLFEKARITNNSSERAKLYEQLAKTIAEDCPVVLGVHRHAISLLQPWVKNYKYQEFAINVGKYLRLDTKMRARINWHRKK